MEIIETARLVIRSFAVDDWQDLQVLAVDKENHHRDPVDPSWPTSNQGCKDFAAYLTDHADHFFAVCERTDRRMIGLLAFNHISADKQLELGYQIHSGCQNNDIDREALHGIIDFVFKNMDIASIQSKTSPLWREQWRPLKALGFTTVNHDAGVWEISKTVWNKQTK